MVFGMPRALFPAMAGAVFGGGTITLGFLYAAPGVGALIGAVTTGWVANLRRQGWAVIVAVCVWGAAIALFGFTDTLWVALVLLAVAGWADVISAVLRNTILQSSIPERFRSRMSSIQMAVVQGGPAPRRHGVGRRGDADQHRVLRRLGWPGLHRRRRRHRRARCPSSGATSPVRSTTCPYDPGMSTTFAEPTWGEVDPAAFSRILVVSPHFDDAAMGAGHLLASYDDTTVVTVLGGRPPAYPDVPSEWDALGGFVAGDDVVAGAARGGRRGHGGPRIGVRVARVRRTTSTWRRPDRPTPADVAPVLGATIAELDPTSVFFPMGLGNPDHVMVHDACLLVREEQPEREWFCYEDHGYKHIPGLLAWRVAKLLRARSPGRRRPSCRTCPTRSASAAPSGATRRRSRRSSRTTRSAPAWRAASPSSSGTWPRRRPAGKALADFI